MPEIIMLPQETTVADTTGITSHIQDLKDFMDTVDLMPDGFSDSESSGDEEKSSHPVIIHSKETNSNEKRLLQTLGRKNGLFERHAPLKMYKNKKAKHSQNVRPKSSGKIKTENQTPLSTHRSFEDGKNDFNLSKEHVINDERQEYNQSEETTLHRESGQHKHHGHSHHHGKKYHRGKSQEHEHHHEHSTHGHHHHHGKHHGKPHHENSIGPSSEQKVTATFESRDLTTFDIDLFKPIMAGQSEDDLNIPIMTPPLPETRNDIYRTGSARTSFYSRPMSFNFLLAGEKLPCNFEEFMFSAHSTKLLSNSFKRESDSCICSSGNIYDETFCGWDAPQRGVKSKLGRRRKFGKPNSSDAVVHRLSHTMGKDPVIFQHYADNIKYIERYRFYHTVGNVGRPLSYTKYEKGVDTDPYYSKLKSNLTSAMAGPFYGFASHLIDEKRGSASSGGSAPDRLRSDDDSIEGSTVEVRPCSMRDRGKALNLAPVREYTVPNLRPTEKMDIMHINHYLNLTTPPVPNDCLQFDIDDVKPKRFAYRAGNSMDSNTIIPTSGCRRGARTLRLGSAEFVKPGTPDLDVKWNGEKRGLQRASTFSNTVQGNLIVGSTVSSPVPPATRAKSGGKVPPYVQFQKDNQHKPHTPPQHVSGQKLKACERVAELTGKERGRFSYTHAAQGEKVAPLIKTATVVDFKETYLPRNRSETITLDVNYLGIRGQPYKQKEQIVLYKNRRAQVTRS